jgi:hypothetical protein
MAQYSDRWNRNVYIYIYIYIFCCCLFWFANCGLIEITSGVVGVLVLLVCKIWVTLKLLMELLFVVVVVIHLLLGFALLSHVGGC